jgi:uncharacterized membrane protein
MPEWTLKDIFDVLMMLAMAVSLSACVGMRAMLPPLVVGILARMEYLTLGDSFSWLSSWPALTVLGLAAAVEIAADKFPAVDNLLDALEIYVKPIVAVLVTAAVVSRIDHPVLALVAGIIVGAPVAGAVQVASMTVRAASTVVTGGLASPAVSSAEDTASAGGSLLAVFLPLVAAILFLATAAILFWWWRKRRRKAA